VRQGWLSACQSRGFEVTDYGGLCSPLFADDEEHRVPAPFPAIVAARNDLKGCQRKLRSGSGAPRGLVLGRSAGLTQSIGCAPSNRWAGYDRREMRHGDALIVAKRRGAQSP